MPSTQFTPALLALVVGFGVTMLELVTSKYPRTFFLMRKSTTLYAYAAVYGAIAFCTTFAFDYLTSRGALKIEGLGLENPWLKAVVVGISAKALMHIRLFTVTTGSQTTPVGIETIVQLFEPWMLRSIDIEHFNKLSSIVNSRAAKYPDLADAKVRAKNVVPSALPVQERAAFANDVDASVSVGKVMELVLTFLGLKSLDLAFPP